jgi:hypothetical protein
MIADKLILKSDILLHEKDIEAEKAKENALFEVAKKLLAVGMTVEQVVRP